MATIFSDITKTTGNTPLIKINRLADHVNCNLFVKLESFNPLSSVKDRVGVALIEQAETEGKLSSSSVIIEPTSGNTGIALAFAAAAKGYKLILTMPETMSVERRKLLQILGAQLVLTDGALGMKGAISKAEQIAEETPNSFMPQQFSNPANPDIHRRTTALEIWEAMDGQIDFFVAGVGTGGTISGVGEFLKSQNQSIQIVAVEPVGSAVISGEEPGPHKIQGIGAGFIPQNLNIEIIDEIIKVSSEEAGRASRMLAKEEGILVGISSGAAFSAALSLAAKRDMDEKNIVVLLPDSGERYLSTWLINDLERI